MNNFQRDFEVIVQNVQFINNGIIRFQMNHMDRMVGSVDNLNLGERAYNTLRRNKIHDIPTLASRLANLGGARGAGKKVVREVKNEFLAYYYSLLDEEERKQFWRDTFEATMDYAGVPGNTAQGLITELKAM